MTQRVITTTQQLDELPDKTVVLNTYMSSVQILREIYPDPSWWHWVITDGGPVEVIWEPEQ